jgi:hypothetical protein
MNAEDVVGMALAAFMIVCFFGALPAIIWLESDGHQAKVARRKAQDALDLERARREMEMDLKLREWQATASLEDLTRHRQRLERGLDELHDEQG